MVGRTKTRKDYTGLVSGKLTAVRYVGTDKRNKSVWLFRCECGTYISRRASNVINDKAIQSCGCIPKGKITHGMTDSPTWNSWRSMIDRCTNSAHPKYKNYGGRGISVDLAWMDFTQFLRDVGERPPNTTLDRIDNDRGYTPSNCRWADKIHQANNKSSVVIIQGQPIMYWVAMSGIKESTIRERVRRWGDVPRVLDPVKPNKRIRRT